MPPMLIFIPLLFVLIIDIWVILAAFETSFKLGVMALIVPMYVVSAGNWRLKTPYRRGLAIAWWSGIACYVLCVAATSL